MFKLKKGDQIVVLQGRDKGRRGKIDRVLPGRNQILVNGLNLVKKHLKSQGEKKPGGIVSIAKPILVSKVALVCPKCNQPTRVGFQIGKDKNKKRVCRKCKKII